MKTHYQRIAGALKELFAKAPVKARPLFVDSAGHLYGSLDAETTKLAEADILIAAEFVNRTTAEDPDALKNAISFYAAVMEGGKWPNQAAVNEATRLAVDASALDVKIVIEDADKAKEAEPRQAMVKMDFKLFGGEKVIKIDQGDLEVKTAGLYLLKTLLKFYAHQLPAESAPRIREVVQASLKVTNTVSVKLLALKCAKRIVTTAAEYDELSQLTLASLRRYLAAQGADNFCGMLLVAAKTLRRLNGSHRLFCEQRLVSLTSAEAWAELLRDAALHAQKIRNVTIKKYKKSDLQDPDVIEELETELEETTEYVRNVMEFCGELVKTVVPPAAQTHIDSTVTPMFLELALRGIGEDEQIIGLCYFADLAEFGSPQFQTMTAVFDKCYSVLASADASESFKQTCVFLLGAAVLRAQGNLPNEAQKTLEYAAQILATNPPASDFIDNVVAAGMKVLLSSP